MNPGRAAILAVALLAVIYTLAQVGFQGVISPAKLQAAAATASRWHRADGRSGMTGASDGLVGGGTVSLRRKCDLVLAWLAQAYRDESRLGYHQRHLAGESRPPRMISPACHAGSSG